MFASPSIRCRQTAEILGLNAEPHPDLAGCAMGRWVGRTLDEVVAAEGEAVAHWLSDPAATPHGGESLLNLCDRVGAWLDALPAGDPGAVLAIVEPDTVRAATLHALGTPGPAFWRLDVRPPSITELSGRHNRWNVRLGR